METASETAWNSLSTVFEALRNEQDQGRLDRFFMDQPVGVIVNDVTLEEQRTMIAARKVDRSHSELTRMNLRDALNKIAHHDPVLSTYRVDGRGAHYLVLGASYRNKKWVAEVLVSTLVKRAESAAKAIC